MNSETFLFLLFMTMTMVEGFSGVWTESEIWLKFCFVVFLKYIMKG